MTTFENRPNEALLVVDVQKGVVGGAHDRDAVVANIASLVDRAREAGTPVVWVQHSDSDGLEIGGEAWQYVDELTMAEGEPVIHKVHGDSFEGTDLGEVLEGLGVGALTVVGAQSDACIRSTIHGAFTRGYDVTLVSDAHTTEDLSEWGAPTPDLVISHTNLYWTFMSAPGKEASVKKAEEVAFG
jgi:nicotinamidase-related amidase